MFIAIDGGWNRRGHISELGNFAAVLISNHESLNNKVLWQSTRAFQRTKTTVGKNVITVFEGNHTGTAKSMETQSFAELLKFLEVPKKQQPTPKLSKDISPFSSIESSRSDSTDSSNEGVLVLPLVLENLPAIPIPNSDFYNPLLHITVNNFKPTKRLIEYFTAFIADKDSGLRAMNTSGIPMWGDPGIENLFFCIY